MYMTHVCFLCLCSDSVGVCGIFCCVTGVVEDSDFSLEILKYAVCLCRGCHICCVLCLNCDTWSCRCSGMGRVGVSSCRCCVVVSCVDPVAVINTAFCPEFIYYSLLMLVEDARGDHMEEVYSIAGLITAL